MDDKQAQETEEDLRITQAYEALFVEEGVVQGDALTVLDDISDFCDYDNHETDGDKSARMVYAWIKRRLNIPSDVIRHNANLVRIHKARSRDADQDDMP